MSTLPSVRFLDARTPPHIVTLVAMASVSALSMSVFLPSLHGMAEYFDADYATMQYAVSGYLACVALSQIVIGPLSDRYGRRPVTLWSLVAFMVVTLGAILAPSAEVFLACRMGQAVIATGMVLSRAIVRDMVADEEAASMIGYVTMGMALVPMLGPMIGGALDELFGWQASFGLLLIAGGATYLLCLKDLGETKQGDGMTFAEQVRTYPELFASRRFWGYAICGGFGAGAFFAFLGGSSYVASTIFGLSPFWAGVGFGAPAVGYIFGNAFSAGFSQTFGLNRMILIGTTITAIGTCISAAISFAGASNAMIFFSFCTLIGLGNGLTLPNATAGLLGVRPHLAGTASGLGGALLLGIGAFLSSLTGWFEGETEFPLTLIMAASAVASVFVILWVMHVERRLTR